MGAVPLGCTGKEYARHGATVEITGRNEAGARMHGTHGAEPAGSH